MTRTVTFAELDVVWKRGGVDAAKGIIIDGRESTIGYLAFYFRFMGDPTNYKYENCAGKQMVYKLVERQEIVRRWQPTTGKDKDIPGIVIGNKEAEIISR